MQHTLTIEGWTPPTINQFFGKHWRIRHKLSRQCKDMIAVHAMQQSIPKASGRRAVLLQVWGWGHGGRLPDRDAFDKLTLDALVACGMLTDDNAKGLAGRMLVEITRSKDKRTEIVLEDC